MMVGAPLPDGGPEDDDAAADGAGWSMVVGAPPRDGGPEDDDAAADGAGRPGCLSPLIRNPGCPGLRSGSTKSSSRTLFSLKQK